MESPISNDKGLYGLVLAGGKSSRMGTDKALLNFHGIPQIDYINQLLNQFCNEVYLSARDVETYAGYGVIEDQYDFEGPLNGILSAFKLHPGKAWVVLACDMPFVDKESIQLLIDNRAKEAMATCYQKQGGKPEPLFCVWESNSHQELKQFVQQGSRSPRAFLMQHPIQTVVPENNQTLLNVNTVEEFEKAKNLF